jgi:uncharacterized coiled-coil protein SlyX
MAAASSESEVIAQQVSALGRRVEALEARLGHIDRVIARLEGAALTMAHSMQEISRHWDAVYEAMRRAEDPDVGQVKGEGGESYHASTPKR